VFGEMATWALAILAPFILASGVRTAPIVQEVSACGQNH
jgi:hypothetical protein